MSAQPSQRRECMGAPLHFRYEGVADVAVVGEEKVAGVRVEGAA